MKSRDHLFKTQRLELICLRDMQPSKQKFFFSLPFFLIQKHLFKAILFKSISSDDNLFCKLSSLSMAGFLLVSFDAEELLEAILKTFVKLEIKHDVCQVRESVEVIDCVGYQVANAELETMRAVIVEC